jgi:MFS family permease
LITNGRRRILIIFGAVACVSTILTQFQSFWMIFSGRLLHGACTGIMVTAGVKMIEETLPAHLISKFGVYPNIYMNFGIMIVMLLGAGLNNKSPKDDWFWRVCYGMPIVVLSIGIILLISFFPEDSINFLVASGQKEEAIKAIARIYENPEEVYERIEKSVNGEKEAQEDTQDVTFGQALQMKATWFCFVLTIFHQSTGLNAINIYSN